MDELNTKVQHHKLHFLYPIADFLIVAIFSLISFLTYIWAGLGDMARVSDTVIFMLSYSFGFAALVVIVFWIFKIYRMLTRNYGFREAIYISLITLVCCVAGLIIILLIQAVFDLKRMSVWSWVLSTICICATLPTLRLSSRVFRLFKNSFYHKDEKIRTIVIGAGQNGKFILDETLSNEFSKNKIVAFVDDDPSKISSTMGTTPILGPISDIAKFVETYHAQEVIISPSAITQKRIKQILEYLEFSNVRVRRMASLNEMNGPNDKRVFNVDVNELLYRSNVLLDNTNIKEYLHNKTVLVTGAGGSIGSELVRQIFSFHPRQLVLFDIYENSTYQIEQELITKMRKENITDVSLVTLIGSVYNLDRIENVISTYKPNVIYHAAAYKHVPLMENSPVEAIRTNVIGTYNVAKLANKYNVDKMVLVSTDKAVRPTNTMGATKRFGEMIIQYFSSISKHTVYGAVRFGNVLGSNGSVIPLFKRQIEDGGPVTITDKEIIRYFMTIPEAVSLILQCSLFAKEGEIFVLDMGKPVKIIELAEKLIKQAGYVPYKDIDIVTIGLRPGEKLYEELLLDTNRQKQTENKKIFIEPSEDVVPIEDKIIEISKAFKLNENQDVKKLLAEIVTTYTVKD